MLTSPNPYADLGAAYSEELREKSAFPAPKGAPSPTGVYTVRNHADVGRGRDAGFRRALTATA